jgi:hypothetical protein
MTLQINFFGDGATTLPQAAWNDLAVVAQFFEHTFTNNITINLAVGWGELGGSEYFSFHGQYYNITGGTGAAEWAVSSEYVTTTYSGLVAALQSHEHSPDDITAVNNLLAHSDPTGGGTVYVPLAEARALGLFESTDNFLDAYVGFNTLPSGLQWNFDPNNRGVPGTVDFIGVAEHEISHALGRTSGLGSFSTIDGSLSGYTPLDFFRFSAPGAPDPNGFSSSDYFSFNSGSKLTTHPLPLASNGQPYFEFQPQGNDNDPGDWGLIGGVNNAFNYDSFGYYNNSGGVPGYVSETDLREMDVMGFTRAPTTKNDFDGNGTSDVVWANGASGSVLLYEMQGSHVVGQATLGGGGGWSVAATGDFDGDNTTDVLWQNSGSGAVLMYEMDGTQVIGQATIGGGGGWSILRTGDFNADGKTDILWRNSTSGGVLMYEMNGTQVIGQTLIGGGGGWSVVGTGDFNADNRTDVLWQNSGSGAVLMYEMNGTQVIGQAAIGGGGGWSVVGTGDFNADNRTDILWQNSGTGSVLMYEMNGTQVIGQAMIGGGGGWSVVGTGDFNGDGKTDILWRNSTSASVLMYEMNGTQVIGQATIGGGGGWSVVGTGDFNADGRTDILWQNSASGAVLMYEMNGTQVIGQAAIGGGGSWNPIQANPLV